jgi:hypothetical protein
MASQAERARRKRARTIAAATDPTRSAPVAVAPPAPRAGAASGPRRGRDDGLDMLVERGRITRQQHDAGRHYGMLWRAAQATGGTPIRVVDIAGAGGGSGRGGDPAEPAESEAAWIADCRAALIDARVALGGHEEMIATVDVICGAGMRPREITTDQRQAEQIETTLRLALDLLWRRFRGEIERLRHARAMS